MNRGTYLSICAGCGFGSHGFDQAGWTGVGFVEWDDDRRAVLRKWHGIEGVTYLSDLRSVRAEHLPKADCWVVSIPCTPFSIGGNMLGLDDPNDLHRPFLRLCFEAARIGRLPRWIVWENVDGWTGSRARRLTRKALAVCGFRASMGGNMNAREFGIPQDRVRAFAVFAADASQLPQSLRTPLDDDPGLLDRTLIRDWPDRFIARDAPDGSAETRKRVAAFHRLLETRKRLALEIPVFAGSCPAPAEWKWEGFVWFMTLKNPSSVHCGYSQTITKDPRLLVRLPDGRLTRATPEAHEWLMGMPEGYTAEGVGDCGERVVLKEAQRIDACGDGIVAPILEAIARSLGCTGQEKKRRNGVVHGTTERASVGWRGRYDAQEI